MKRNWIPLFSLLVAGVLAFFMWRQTQSTIKMTDILAFNANIAPGTIITPELLVTIQMDETILNNAVLTPLVNPADVVGKVARYNIMAGTPIYREQFVEKGQYSFQESENSYFISFGLDELNVTRLPYGFVKGKITLCMVVQNSQIMGQFPIGLPPQEIETLRLQDIRCPVRNIQAVALTADNMLPWTYMVYDPEAQKYVAGPEPAKIGFWISQSTDPRYPMYDENGNVVTDENGNIVPDREAYLKILTRILLRPQATTAATTKLFFILPPQEYNNTAPEYIAAHPEAQTVIEEIDTVNPYEEYELIYRPDEIKAQEEQGLP